MKRLLTHQSLVPLLLWICTLPVSAHHFEVDGIYYDIKGDEAIVTFAGAEDFSFDNEYFGDVVIPSTVNHNGKTYKVTAIGNSAFDDCIALTSITIPSTVTSIGYEAFADCESLKRVNISDLVAWCNINVSYEAFGHDTSYDLCLNGAKVTDLVIPNSVTTIPDYAFARCASIISVTIPATVTSIGSHAFYYCSNLSNISIPNSVTAIGSYAFIAHLGMIISLMD